MDVPLVIPVLEPETVEEVAPCPLPVDKDNTPVVDTLLIAVVVKTLDELNELDVRPPTGLDVDAVED